MDKDLKKLVTALEAAGYEVTRNKKGHIEVRKEGRKVATFGGTPSDRRSWLNSLAPLKRDGFVWPPER